jgi:hypothetical protein
LNERNLENAFQLDSKTLAAVIGATYSTLFEMT